MTTIDQETPQFDLSDFHTAAQAASEKKPPRQLSGKLLEPRTMAFINDCLSKGLTVEYIFNGLVAVKRIGPNSKAHLYMTMKFNPEKFPLYGLSRTSL